MVSRIRDDFNRRLISRLKIPGIAIGCLAALDEVFESLKFVQVVLELQARLISAVGIKQIIRPMWNSGCNT